MGPQRGRNPLDNFGGPVYDLGSASAECYGDQPDYENWHLGEDSTGSYDPYMDYNEGYAEYGERGECSDVSLRTDSEFDRGEDPALEVEEVLHRGPPSVIDVESADSRSEEPPAPKRPPKAPPRRCRSGAGKLSRAVQREVTSFEEETHSTRAYSPGTCAPVPKPRRGKGEATPVLTPETGNVTGAPPEMGARTSQPSKSVRGDPPAAGLESHLPKTGGHTGAPAGFLGLFNSPLCSFVPVPVVLPPSILLTLACGSVARRRFSNLSVLVSSPPLHNGTAGREKGLRERAHRADSSFSTEKAWSSWVELHFNNGGGAATKSGVDEQVPSAAPSGDMEKMLLDAQHESGRSSSRGSLPCDSPPRSQTPLLLCRGSEVPSSAEKNSSQSDEDYVERRREVDNLMKKNPDWIWDWSSRPENVPPKPGFPPPGPQPKDQPLAPTYQRDQPLAPTYQRDQPLAPTYQRDQPLAPTYQRDQPLAPTYQRDQPLAPTYQPLAPTYQPLAPTYQRDQPLAPTYQRDQPLAPTYQRDQPLAGRGQVLSTFQVHK
ncbi:hypothetical protein P4O66_001526 [Electrophorus voltai]|uniref:Uncharacterized protein n=1 Tax=Electrophorus voltai TaxID=2609070 RepID=A0AAD8Z6J3_9TELE|nr:hypothetical protein P4O66_001526 [Electrophorus voltai]